MAARWGAGEETLTACNMDFFPMDTLNETAGLTSGETLEVFQSLDPTILSMFEDTPIVETKGLDEESEATLLTALTEILDNVDDENLSPFDTLPDSDLLSGQKGREHSPLRRLLCLSRSPPDTLCNTRPSSTGKSMPRIHADSIQRSDGEEEEDGSFTLSPASHGSYPDSNLLDWKGLTLPLPVTFEQEEEDGISVCLGDLVRHMHPYCMTISMENDEGEQMLPEGGILLEVVDQGENGEPILAIPDMDLPVSLALEAERKMSEEAEDEASDSSEHIVVDDEDVKVPEAPVKVATTVAPGAKDEMVVKRQTEEIREKSPPRRKKKKKSKEQLQPEPAEGRVLRSGRVRNTAQESPQKPERRSKKEEKKQRVAKDPPASASTSPSEETKKLNSCQTETQKEITTTTPSPVTKVQEAAPVSPNQEAALSRTSAEKSPPSCSEKVKEPEETPKQFEEIPDQTAQTPKEPKDSLAAPSAVLSPVPSESPTAALGPPSLPMTPPVSEALPSVAPAVPEPKPKSLSLAEYRRLRQQKKPAPVEKQDDNSTKWPSLPELPKELPPIPCLPDPSLRDPRRLNPPAAKKEVEEVRPAWQPRGPCAPPTPEALLAPPAYMVASNNKASSATPVPKPQQTPEQPKPSPPPKPAAANSMKSLPAHEETTAAPAAPCVPQSSDRPGASDRKCSPALLEGNAGVTERPRSQPESAELAKTTTEMIKPAAAAVVSALRKITVVSLKAPEVTAPRSLNNSTAFDGTPSKPTAHSPPAANPSDLQRAKEDPVVLEKKEKPTAALKPQRAKSPTQELIEAFTSEIGIEAADLTSLLEQFEETQAKEEQSVSEVSGRAAAVGNSSVESAPEKTVVERVRANDLSSTAALTPPATPPHQMWKPLTPVALLGKSKAAEASKSCTSKVIQIEARPLPSVRSRNKATPSLAAASVAPDIACMDHDYCLPNKGASNIETGKSWNAKQQSLITIKPITTQISSAVPSLAVQSNANPVATCKPQVTLRESLDHRTDGVERSSVLETPDASPSRSETDGSVKEASPRGGPYGRSYRRHAASRTPSPKSSPKERIGARSRKRRPRRSPSPVSSSSESESHSSRSRSRSQSRSRSPSKKRYRSYREDRSSSSSSRSSSRSSPSVSRSPPRRRRYSYSSSRSGSWSRSRSRSGSPERRAHWSRSRRLQSPLQRPRFGTKTNVEEVKRCKEKAIEERRVVYVGRIRGTMTQKELKERFSLFGDIEDCTLHFRDHGDNYGFVTYYSTKDAFTAIENGGKLRKPDELPFDLCFGGRRQFCQTSYADLDSNREYDPSPAKSKFHSLDFDTLLKQAQQNLKR
ncbi:peroxisome proliferator-activated receptor gamma coactivator-related protein 1 [Xyrichtys novacula]|uniref:Peroxisome proliferator-activated receptor gamma coactivator-related protein 1 n=1 Tax=Xyrichtys novacula TaxID=13765 RepID=A0AAV1G360_XYRNO|nr:peroxisome proliferator-activated receptor gamma coactivator-related protein 1 [Xyrichtys novacula]